MHGIDKGFLKTYKKTYFSGLGPLTRSLRPLKVWVQHQKFCDFIFTMHVELTQDYVLCEFSDQQVKGLELRVIQKSLNLHCFNMGRNGK